MLDLFRGHVRVASIDKAVKHNLVAVLSVEQSDPLIVAITLLSTDGSL